jgi:cobalt/nickel transport protein
MRVRIGCALALLCSGLAVEGARAHFTMLLPQTPAAKRGEPVSVVYQWGHPFEHQLFDAAAPESVYVVAPDGQRTDLVKALQRISVPTAEQKQAAAYRITFTPQRRGDHLLVLTAPPVWMADEQEFWQDTVKVVVHVQTQNGWDRSAGAAFEMVPLTRPYGLQPGMAFQAQVLVQGKPLAAAPVEIERYNAEPPKELPPDEQVTRAARTDPNGVVTGTLTEPGWWCLTARRDGGQRTHEGKPYPVRQRTTLWIFVDERGSPAPPK